MTLFYLEQHVSMAADPSFQHTQRLRTGDRQAATKSKNMLPFAFALLFAERDLLAGRTNEKYAEYILRRSVSFSVQSEWPISVRPYPQGVQSLA